MAKKMTGKLDKALRKSAAALERELGRAVAGEGFVVLEEWKMPRTGYFGDKARIVYDAKQDKVLTQVSVDGCPYYNADLFSWEWPND